ncbi:MAG TPA: 7-cyano-7-deazaguanine synthase, partial [Polyangia bacterium]|nr:7-cyano-7-deazaguanine synthase [Polyangia bacterium]
MARLDSSVLALDAARETGEIAERLRELVLRDLRKRGVVVAVSGGVDSSVCLALAVQAFGPQKVLALLLPERESSSSSLTLGRAVTEQLGVKTIVHELTAALEGLGAYQARDQAIRQL